MAATFVPRTSFPKIDSIPRTYFLGHHKAGLERMKSMLSRVDHVIECRDYRIPMTSINPLLEKALGGRGRSIVYMKRDLGGDRKLENQVREKKIIRWDQQSPVYFVSKLQKATIAPIIKYFRNTPIPIDQLFGYRVLVVGMPNIGKSTLVNHLRNYGLSKAKVARTGADPGITRRIGNAVKIMEKRSGSIYIYDTPGVFVPYMPDAESMLKLALCGSVKDAIIPVITLADYLLYQLNLFRPHKYQQFSKPTNDIMEFLERVAMRSGRLAKGGTPDIEAAARYFIHLWRSGKFGAFMMDDVDVETAKRRAAFFATPEGKVAQLSHETVRMSRTLEQIKKKLTVESEDEMIVHALDTKRFRG